MHSARLFFLAAVLALTLAPVVAHAQISADDLGFGVKTKALFGKEKPEIILQPTIPLAFTKFDCTRADGKKVLLGSGAIRAGAEKRIVIPQEKGVFVYKCNLFGKSGRESFGPFPAEFEVKVGQPPRIDIKPEDVDTENHRITVRLSEPAWKIELDIIGDNGSPIATVVKEFQSAPPGTPLTVEWKQQPDEVMARFMLQAFEPAEFFNGLESVTFVDIPHEDVVFETNKWDILPSEEGKLIAPLGEIMGELRKVAGAVPIELYIGGYTDTVGQPADNIELSKKRANSIAQWFAKKGLNVPIHFQGFGEGVLKVPTPDGTDEIRNRRASYVLSTQPPPANRGFPTKNWMRAR